MVATSKEDGVKPKRAGFALGGFLPKVPTYRKDKGAKDEPSSVLEQEAEEEPVLDDNQDDQAGELPDFPGERRSHDGVVPVPSAAAVAAAAIRRRGMSIEQTATSLYRRVSVRQNSAPEPVETTKTSLTGSTGSSSSPRSDPGFQARRGMCVVTTFGTGTVLDVRHEDGFFVVQLVPKNIAYLREETIIREIKSVVGERVKTRWGMATVEQYYVDEDMYSIALDWRWDDEHVWRMKATTKKFEKVPPRGTLIQNTKNRLFEGYSSLRESVGSKLNTTSKSVPVSTKLDDVVEQVDLGKAQTPFGVCTVLDVRADKFFVVKTPCGATAYLNADSVRMLERRTHFADGDRVSTPFGFGHIAHFREDDQAYAVKLESPPLAGQSPLLFISDAQAETALTHAPAANARLSSILNITRASMMNAGERMRSASVAAGGLPTLPANLPTLPGNLPTLSSVKAKVSSMATIKMTPRPKFHKDERVLTTFGSGFVVESRPHDKIYQVYLRRLKCSGYFHESSLSPFPYERVTHFVVDGRTVLAPPIPKNASEYKRRAVISAAIKSAREGKYLEPTAPAKPVGPNKEEPEATFDATAAAEAAVAVDAAAATAASVPVPVPVAE
ncbi:hypothetical protein PF005_g3159 [Phytophthora fragariae]|uniref:Uncharacterized protein n=1 Tax=Phytophthora fragariae TaxID=53985 RepID=A0A6A3FR38_9STRA|nr:hypothetical protein PF003_g28242 [Phytophthora fragariae]KAE8946946.1 hypothetical protein PF009_g3440 [Phytophthora fragariae]KAE9022691.1 hypothetical protein PF011_g4327 [Phytophthora fragariae]KAE9133345.1 hypothetical protein PF010_g2863 [Phytophthora fragariae]KAE9133889.1 hypothetical protein PF007_g3173 [Phytophthora fragariae]